MAKKKKRLGVNFKWLFRQGVELECDDLLSFIDTMDSGIKGEMHSFGSFLDRLTDGMDDDRKAHVIEQYADDAFGLLDRYPIIVWQSVFISLYSFFEQEMNDICRRVRRMADEKGIAKTSVAKSKNVVLPGQRCLSQFKVKLATRSRQWKRLIACVAIRNLIVHNRGSLRTNDDESERVKVFVQHARHIKIDNHGRLVLDRVFCAEMVEAMRTVLLKTIAAIPKRMFES